jgi:hypothetical protein
MSVKIHHEDYETISNYDSKDYKVFCDEVALIVSKAKSGIRVRAIKEKLLKLYDKRTVDKFLFDALKSLEQTREIENISRSVSFSEYVAGDGNFEILKKVSKRESGEILSQTTFPQTKKDKTFANLGLGKEFYQ